MRCPKCKRIEDRVIDSRPVNHCSGIRRRRVCLNCAFRFTTYEEIEHTALLVTKRDGRHEPFERQKLRAGIIKACEKRPVNLEAIDQAVEEIVQDVEMSSEREVKSFDLGARVMEKLHTIDKVAYVRYASVYRQFEDIGAFLEEINRLERRPVQNGLQSELFS